MKEKMKSMPRYMNCFTVVDEVDGEFVRDLLDKLRVSPSIFAQALGVDENTVIAWMSEGGNQPSY